MIFGSWPCLPGPPAWAGPVRCTIVEQQTMHQLHTVCDDGTRAVKTYNKTLSRWETTVTPPPGRGLPHAEGPGPAGGGTVHRPP
jgi:hypothetical protein